MFWLSHVVLRKSTKLETMTCFHSNCSNGAKFWRQTCQRKFCNDCVEKPHYRLPAGEEDVAETLQDETNRIIATADNAAEATLAANAAMGTHNLFERRHAGNWLVVIGVAEDIINCHYCNMCVPIQRAAQHCRGKKHLKKMREHHIAHS